MSDEQEKNTGAPDFSQLELSVLETWKQESVFEKSLQQTEGKEPYIFYDGPPFATGLPHYGHILGSAVKDFYGRYYTMRGHFVRRRWGWDCHGLPIENIVEQNLKISGKKQIEQLGVGQFNAICRDNVLKFAEEWGKTVERMGRWVDFENSYKTMDTSYMESVWWGLRQMWDKGLVYEDRKVLLYCSRCETPISNFEVAMDNSYRDVTEDSVFVKFRLSPRQRVVSELTDEKTFALAWTTTPWTLPGNTSLNIGPDIAYVMVRQQTAAGEEKYILAKDRLEMLEGPYEFMMEFSSRSLEGLEYEPLYPGVVASNGRQHRIYLADFVTTTDGTGIVHNAAMYGEDDYRLAKEKDLPRHDMLDAKGQYLGSDNIPENLRGVFFKDADKLVLQELSARGLVYKILAYTHSYPHCYRCGTPLFYNALPAWFIDIQKIKPRLMETAGEINWYPGHLKEGRFGKSLEQAPDWNISRNRYWATALPFWRCINPDCRKVVCMGSIQELAENSPNFKDVYPAYEYGSEKVDHLDLHKPYIDEVVVSCQHCRSEMRRVPEVVDCWVESASMPFAELHYPFENKELFENRYPADFVAEYIAQTRAWFYVMHVVNTVLFDAAPFRHVVTTGNILAEDGAKMSKSKKNYPDPSLLIEKYGVDAMRFYLLTCPVMNADDVNFSEKSVMEINRKVSLLIYNVWSFYKMYRPQNFTAGAPESVHVLDRWMVQRTSQMIQAVSQQLEQYSSIRAGREIVKYVDELSTWYLRRSRDRLKAGGSQGEQAGRTLAYALTELAKVLAPFMPFLADAVYRDITGETSVHLAAWPEAHISVDESLLADMDAVRLLTELGLSLRKEKNLKVRQPLAELQFAQAGQPREFATELLQVLAEELNVKKVSIQQGQWGETWAQKASPEFSVALDTQLTPELKREGQARELERAVQDLRKKSGMKVGELADVYYNTQDAGLEAALIEMFDRKKTFVNQIKKSFEVEVDFEIQMDVDGHAVWLGITRL